MLEDELPLHLLMFWQLGRSMTASTSLLEATTCQIVNPLEPTAESAAAVTWGVWDEYVDKHPRGSVFHTSPMIRAMHAAKAHSVLPLAAVDGSGAIVAMLVAVRVQTLPNPLGIVSSRSIFYAEPICEQGELGVEALKQLLREHDRAMGSTTLFSEVRPLCAPETERTALEISGFEFSDYLNYLIDLSLPQDKLWSNLNKSTRRGVQQCEKRGYQVRPLDSPEDIPILYEFLVATYQRAQVPLADISLFEAAFAELHPRGMLQILATFDGDTPLAIDSLLTFKGRTYAWYGGVKRVTGASPFDLLQWHEFLWAKQRGCHIYDFGGAGWPDEPYGVREYKAKFGGELVHFGRYRKPYSKWRLKLARRAYQIGRAIVAPK